MDLFFQHGPFTSFGQILYCYGIYRHLFDEMEGTVKNFRSKQGLPSSEELEEFTTDSRHKLIAIDDLMHRVVEDKEIKLLFTQGTHHKCVSVIFITQNLYPRGKHARTIALNILVLGIDGEFLRRFPSRYTWSTAIPRLGKRVHKSLPRRSRFQTGLFDSGYESIRGRPIPFEE